MKWTIYLITILVLTSCISTYQIIESNVLANETYYQMLNLIECQSFKVDSTKRKIPIELKRAISKFNEEKFRIADPDDRCNLGCVRHFPNAPNRQMSMVAISDSSIILTYIKGGRGISSHIIIAKIDRNKILNIWTGRGWRNLNSPEKVIEWMRKHKPEDLNSNFVNL